MSDDRPGTILITRIIDASRARVYRAFLTPADLMNWHYATEGWTTPYAKVDARRGGEFHIGFQSPDGKTDFDFGGTYDEIVTDEKIAYTIADGRKVWVAFADEGGKTKIDLTLTLENLYTPEQQRDGWDSMLVHLGEYLTKA